MNPTLRALRHSVLFFAFTTASSACRFAAEAAETAAKVSGAATEPVAPKSAVQVRRSVIQPTLNVDEMTDEQVRETLKRLQARQSRFNDVQKTIRFNNGTETTFYSQGEKMYGGGIAKGGEVKSARDSGTLSLYGMGRNPISLYSNQWLELLEFGPDICTFIVNHQAEIDEYIAKANAGNSAGPDRKINEDLLLHLLGGFEKGGLWTPPVDAEASTEGTEVVEPPAEGGEGEAEVAAV
jgi:hypothetical protein